MPIDGRQDVGTPLPLCVVGASEEAENLYDLVVSSVFPELPLTVEDIAEAARLAAAALQWGWAIDEAHAEVVAYFPRREEGISVELPDPVTAYFSRDVQEGKGRVVYRRMDMDIASDVLEPIPAKFERTMVTAFPVPASRSLDGQESEVDRLAKGLAYDWTDGTWAEVREQIVQWRLVVRAKCLGLVAWIRRGVAEMESATLPTVVWESHRKHNGHTVRVSMAEAERLVDLTGSEHALLSALAKSRPAPSYRTTKAALMRKIPELDPYVKSQGAASETESRYEVPSAVAERLRVQPLG